MDNRKPGPKARASPLERQSDNIDPARGTRKPAVRPRPHLAGWQTRSPMPGRPAGVDPQREEPANKRTCANCVFARWMTNRWPGQLLCVNHPDAQGEIKEVIPCSTCPNFRARREPPLRLPAPEPPAENLRTIALTHGKHAIVDAEDYDRLMEHKWTAYFSGGHWYAARNDKGHCVLMHREIMHAPKDKTVDHIDHNSLNNPKFNLRLCTQGQNNCNRRPRGKSSKYKGVSRDKERNLWLSTAWYKGKCVFVGRFEDEIEAARASDLKNVEFNGEYAYLNFPEDWPRERIKAVYEAAEPERQRLEALGAEKKDKERRKNHQ